jgi:hypothetical protein
MISRLARHAGRVATDSIYTSYSVYANPRIPNLRPGIFHSDRPLTDLKAKLRIEGAYNLTTSHSRGYDYASTYLRETRTDQDIKPFGMSSIPARRIC